MVSDRDVRSKKRNTRNKGGMQDAHHVVPKSSSHEGVRFLAQMETVGGKVGAIGTTVLSEGKIVQMDINNSGQEIMSQVCLLIPLTWGGKCPS